MIIHADYMLEGTLKVIKSIDGFKITNPGVLKIPKEQIFKGGNSKARNPRMQSMLRMVGYGDNVDFGQYAAGCGRSVDKIIIYLLPDCAGSEPGGYASISF
ncbi:MAG: hypothetical protein HDR01_06625 [Lachnospiraceae bacterium]|nr:hypothetical protein [Lachnospiraceae bacterium]